MKGKFLPAITLLLASLLAASCAAKPEALRAATPSDSPGTKAPIAVSVMEAKPSVQVEALLVPAALSVEVTALILAQRDGTVSQLRAQEGSRVNKGQVIAQLTGDEDLRAQLRQAELEVSRLDVEQRQYAALIKLDRNELDRETILFKQGLTADRDVERAQFKLDAAVLELEKTKVASDTARAKVVEVKAQLERSTVRAPISGVVIHRFAKLGTNVVKNDKLFEITQLGPLEVKFQVPQNERGSLAAGSIISLLPIENDQIIARARIRRMDKVAESASNTVGFVADIVSGPGLMPGMAVNVSIPRSDVGPTLWLPQTAFPVGTEIRKGGTSTIFVAVGELCAARTVWVNSVEADQVEVGSGLAEGDRVIISPPAELKAGDRVAVKN